MRAEHDGEQMCAGVVIQNRIARAQAMVAGRQYLGAGVVSADHDLGRDRFKTHRVPGVGSDVRLRDQGRQGKPTAARGTVSDSP